MHDLTIGSTHAVPTTMHASHARKASRRARPHERARQTKNAMTRCLIRGDASSCHSPRMFLPWALDAITAGWSDWDLTSRNERSIQRHVPFLQRERCVPQDILESHEEDDHPRKRLIVHPQI